MPLHVFPTVPWFHIRLFGGLVPHFRAVLCHRMQYLCVSVWILYKPVEECVVREMEVKGFILEDISVRCLQPLSSYDLISFSFFFMYYVFHVLSAFYGIKCLCQEGGRINPMDFAALKTVSVGFWLAISFSVLCSSTFSCLHICLAPIGQTKVWRGRAVSLVNSPQVSIYF